MSNSVPRDTSRSSCRSTFSRMASRAINFAGIPVPHSDSGLSSQGDDADGHVQEQPQSSSHRRGRRTQGHGVPLVPAGPACEVCDGMIVWTTAASCYCCFKACHQGCQAPVRIGSYEFVMCMNCAGMIQSLQEEVRKGIC